GPVALRCESNPENLYWHPGLPWVPVRAMLPNTLFFFAGFLYQHRLRPFRPLFQFVFDIFSLSQRSKALHLNRGMVYKYITRLFAGDESITLLIAKPFHFP